MIVVRGLRNLHEKPKNAVVTLGNFDGVHMGHQVILKLVFERAKENNGSSIVYTFDPHPLKILAPEQNINLLTTFKKKMELLDSNKVDMAICADFTKNFARMHPGDFVAKLMDSLAMKRVIVGHDYSFGKGKTGTIEYLEILGKKHGFTVDVADPVTSDGVRVSSSAIRELLYEGDVGKAGIMLNRYYSMEGHVVSGYQRGKAIGFPTANLDTPYEVIPAVGVYAVYTLIGGNRWHEAVVNVGYNPTFDRNDLIVEVHLLDTEQDIYGQEIEVFFIDRLRDETRFDSVEELKAQIEKDISKAKEIFAITKRPESSLSLKQV